MGQHRTSDFTHTYPCRLDLQLVAWLHLFAMHLPSSRLAESVPNSQVIFCTCHTLECLPCLKLLTTESLSHSLPSSPALVLHTLL